MRRRSFHIDDATWYALRARAAADNTTIAAIIRDLITTHLTTPKETP